MSTDRAWACRGPGKCVVPVSRGLTFAHLPTHSEEGQSVGQAQGHRECAAWAQSQHARNHQASSFTIIEACVCLPVCDVRCALYACMVGRRDCMGCEGNCSTPAACCWVLPCSFMMQLVSCSALLQLSASPPGCTLWRAAMLGQSSLA
jgi:hypothetical protein